MRIDELPTREQNFGKTVEEVADRLYGRNGYVWVGANPEVVRRVWDVMKFKLRLDDAVTTDIVLPQRHRVSTTLPLNKESAYALWFSCRSEEAFREAWELCGLRAPFALDTKWEVP